MSEIDIMAIFNLVFLVLLVASLLVNVYLHAQFNVYRLQMADAADILMEQDEALTIAHNRNERLVKALEDAQKNWGHNFELAKSRGQTINHLQNVLRRVRRTSSRRHIAVAATKRLLKKAIDKIDRQERQNDMVDATAISMAAIHRNRPCAVPMIPDISIKRNEDSAPIPARPDGPGRQPGGKYIAPDAEISSYLKKPGFSQTSKPAV